MARLVGEIDNYLFIQRFTPKTLKNSQKIFGAYLKNIITFADATTTAIKNHSVSPFGVRGGLLWGCTFP